MNPFLNIEHTNCWFLFYYFKLFQHSWYYDFLLPQIGSEELSVLDKFLIVGLEGWLSTLATFTLDQSSILRNYICRLTSVCNSSSRGMTPILLKRRESPQIHTYPIHMNKKMNAKIFFVHRSKYHKSDYKFHHTDSYNHPWYLSCGLSSLGHSQVAENIRCLILIFWENNFVTEKATDRWSDNFASPLFWYVLSPVWLVGVCDDWKTISPWPRVKSLPKSFRRRSPVWILDSSLVLRL